MNKGKILSIDDEQGIRDMLSFTLRQHGYTIDTAQSGEEGLEKVRKESFDIVITDIKMPGMDGITVLGEIKKINPEVEVIIATGYGTMETAIEGLRKGAFDYIGKPFNIDEVTATVKRALEKRRFKETVALYEISKNLFSTIELNDLLKIIIDLTSKVLKADDVSIMLFDDKGKLYIANSYGLDEEARKNTRLFMGKHISDWMKKESQSSVLISEPAKDSRFKDIKGCEKIKSSIALSLKTKDAVLGVLTINKTDINEDFSEDDLHKANIINSFITLSVENSNLYKKLRKTQMMLAQQGRLASIGELASGLAHEIGNPLQAILGNTELLLMEEKNEELDSIKTAVLHAKKIIENLLIFSGRRKTALVQANINDLLEQTFSLYGKQLEIKKIEVVKKYGNLPKMNISSLNIEQVFLNLITNATKAMPEGGILTVMTSVADGASQAYAKEEKDTTGSNPRMINISFKDTGSGIKKDNLARIFEPFFTTSEVGKGTGLGLSVSYGIMKEYGGEILVFSEGEGKGAEFIVKIPLK